MITRPRSGKSYPRATSLRASAAIAAVDSFAHVQHKTSCGTMGTEHPRPFGRGCSVCAFLLNGGDGVARFGDGAGQRLVAGIALDGGGAGNQVHIGGDAGQVVKGLLHPAGAVGAHHSLNLYGLHRDSYSFLFL